MLHVMLGHGSGSGSAVTIKREGDEVVVGVVLGPDSSVTAETERAWLARMAIRYGGRYELVGQPGGPRAARPRASRRATTSRSSARSSTRRASRARPTRASSPPSGPRATSRVAQSSYPPPATPAADRHGAVARFAGGVAATLRAMLSPVGRELAELRSARRQPAKELARPRGRRARPTSTSASSRSAAGCSRCRSSSPSWRPSARATRTSCSARWTSSRSSAAEVRALEARAARTGVEVIVRTVPEDAARARRPRVVAAIGRASWCARSSRTHCRRRRAGSAVIVTVQRPGRGRRRGARRAHRRRRRRAPSCRRRRAARCWRSRSSRGRSAAPAASACSSPRRSRRRRARCSRLATRRSRRGAAAEFASRVTFPR